MTHQKTDDRGQELLFQYDLDAPPEKVWRAISIPALREKWLPDIDFAQPEPLFSTRNAEIRYRMRDKKPPFLESLVTLKIRPDNNGGTILTIIHRLDDARLNSHTSPAANPAANDATSCLMLAA